MPDQSVPHSAGECFHRGVDSLSAGNFSDANQLLTAAFEKDPSFVTADNLLARAQALMQLGESDAARRDIDRSIELNPNKPEAYMYLASFHVGQSQINEAVEVLGKAMNLAQGDKQLLAQIGVMARQIQQTFG